MEELALHRAHVLRHHRPEKITTKPLIGKGSGLISRKGSRLAVMAMAAVVQPATIALAPPAASVGFRAYVLGFVPVDGRFARFHGELSFEDGDRRRCRLDLEAETGSLELSNPARTRQVTGPEFLDAATFPTLRFVGACQGERLDGVLTLHGVSRPLTLAVAGGPGVFEAAGDAVRADWGITAQAVTIGARLRLSISVPLAP